MKLWDKDTDNVVYPGEILTYGISIINNMENTTGFLLQEKDYNKYLSTTENDTMSVKDKAYNVENLISPIF